MPTKSRLTTETPEVAVVRVRDDNGVDHRFAIEKDSGDVADHECHGYPSDRSEWSEDARRATRAAAETARYVTHHGTEASIVRPAERAENVRSAIDAIERLSDGAFVRHFRAFHDRLRNPPEDVPGAVTAVTTLLFLEGDRIEYATDPILRIETDSGTHRRYDNPADEMAAPDRQPDARIEVSPGAASLPLGQEFRAFLLDRLRADLEEVRRRRGETGPEASRFEAEDASDAGRGGAGAESIEH